jgi:membrane protein
MAVNLFSLNGVTLKQIVQRTWTEIRADDVLGRAAQLAYYFFLALFPFLICVIASLSVFGFADRGRMLLLFLLARFVPAPAVQLIGATIDQVIQASGPLKMSFGIVASLWSASMGMGAIMSTLNAAYKVPETRSLFRQYLVAIELTAGIAVLLITSVLIAVFGDDVIAALASGNFVFAVWKIAKWPLGFVLLALAFEITYYFAPDLSEPDWHWITPGTLAGIFLLIAVSIGSRIYLRYSSSYGAAYGSLGAVIVLLLWFYLSGIALLAGGVLNAVLQDPVAANIPAPSSPAATPNILS